MVTYIIDFCVARVWCHLSKIKKTCVVCRFNGVSRVDFKIVVCRCVEFKNSLCPCDLGISPPTSVLPFCVVTLEDVRVILLIYMQNAYFYTINRRQP